MGAARRVESIAMVETSGVQDVDIDDDMDWVEVGVGVDTDVVEK